MLIEMAESDTNDLIPLWRCQCRLPNGAKVLRNPEYCKEGFRLVLKKLKCNACGGKYGSELQVNCREMFTRNLDFTEYKTFENPSTIRMEGFYGSSIIQYSKRRRHYRCIKILGRNKIRILDGEKVVTMEGEAEKAKALEDR